MFEIYARRDTDRRRSFHEPKLIPILHQIDKIIPVYSDAELKLPGFPQVFLIQFQFQFWVQMHKYIVENNIFIRFDMKSSGCAWIKAFPKSKFPPHPGEKIGWAVAY